MKRITACLLITLVAVAIIVQDYPDWPLYEGPSPFVIKTLPTTQHVTIHQRQFIRQLGLSHQWTDQSTHLRVRHRTVEVACRPVCLSLPLLI